MAVGVQHSFLMARAAAVQLGNLISSHPISMMRSTCLDHIKIPNIYHGKPSKWYAASFSHVCGTLAALQLTSPCVSQIQPMSTPAHGTYMRPPAVRQRFIWSSLKWLVPPTCSPYVSSIFERFFLRSDDCAQAI